VRFGWRTTVAGKIENRIAIHRDGRESARAERDLEGVLRKHPIAERGRGVRGVAANLNQLGRTGVGLRIEQHGFDGGEDYGCRADAERGGEERDCGGQRIAAKEAQGQANIVKQTH
jgi:hypothetical protein